ncbi:MAG: hypothetical protein ACJ8D1_03370, partial [Microvirga sp.]
VLNLSRTPMDLELYLITGAFEIFDESCEIQQGFWPLQGHVARQVDEGRLAGAVSCSIDLGQGTAKLLGRRAEESHWSYCIAPKILCVAT